MAPRKHCANLALGLLSTILPNMPEEQVVVHPQHHCVKRWFFLSGQNLPLHVCSCPKPSVPASDSGCQAILSMRRWTFTEFGSEQLITFVAMATQDDLNANAEFIRLADSFVEVPSGPLDFSLPTSASSSSSSYFIDYFFCLL